MELETPDTIDVPRELLINHLTTVAEESDDWTIYLGLPDGVEPEWGLEDVEDWTVEVTSEGELRCFGEGEGTYSVQASRARYNPPERAHPAEYKTETFRFMVDITTDWSEGFGIGCSVVVERW